MDIIELSESTRVKGLVRGFEIPADLCPDSDAEFRRWWPELRRRAEIVFEHHNIATNAGLEAVAQAIASGVTSLVYPASGKVYQQALGTANGTFTLSSVPLVYGAPNRFAGTASAYSVTAPLTSDTILYQEAYRKPISAATVSLTSYPILTVSTYFQPTEFYSWQSTVAGSPSPTTSGFTVTAPSADVSPWLRPGDLIRFPTSGGYAFAEVALVNGQAITLAAPSALPATVGGVVMQCIAEAGMFGDEYASPAAVPANSSAAVSQGTTAVTGTNTAFTKVGGYFRGAVPYNPNSVPVSPAWGGYWYPIASSGSDTALTLQSAFGDPSLAAASTSPNYAINGTMFNHVNNLNYVKLSTRGLVIEVYWSLKGV